MVGRALVANQSIANPWTSRIIRAWQLTTQSFFECGRLLVRAKADLGYGEYLKMIDRDLPFGPRYAQMLARVASDPRLTDTKCVALLPPNIGALYELSRLDDVSFRRAQTTGRIRPEMERHDAASLVLKNKRHLRLGRAAQQNFGSAISLWLVDPPWRPSGFTPPYKTLSIDAIRSLRMRPDGRASTDHAHPSIAEASAPCAAIAIWAIDEMLFEAESVLGGWGYEHIGPRIIWSKGSHGRAGRAALMQHEYLLIGVRGGAIPTWRPPSVVSIPRAGLRHSEKPKEFHGILEKMFPLLIKRCELFARIARPGWRGWGDQLPAA